MLAYLWVLFTILALNYYPNKANANVIGGGKPHLPPNLRVLHGNDAEPHSAPYMVAMYTKRYINKKLFVGFCGGTLISHNYVLTAAHCIRGVSQVQLILGAHNWRKREPSQVRYTLRFNNTADGNHSESTYTDFIKYDISLLKLRKPVSYNQYIQPIKLPANDSINYEGQKGRLYGWGYTDTPPTIDLKYLSSELKYADFPIANSSDCVPTPKDYRGNICILAVNGKGNCMGDSGGPLIINGIQIGVMSYGMHICAEQNDPVHFTRVGYFLKWIRKNSDYDPK